jgi:hypothetical protein
MTSRNVGFAGGRRASSGEVTTGGTAGIGDGRGSAACAWDT